MDCAGCRRDLGDHQARAGCICYEQIGNEIIESWWHCPDCDTYMVEYYEDAFMGDDSVSQRGPVAAAEAQDRLARIAACPDPLSKRCRCATHADFGR